MEIIIAVILGILITPFALSGMIWCILRMAEHDNRGLDAELRRRVEARILDMGAR